MPSRNTGKRKACFKRAIWKSPDKKAALAPFRNYHNADSILSIAYETANKAAIDAKDRYMELDTQAENAREGLKNELTNYREALDGALANFNAERYWSTADLALKMSQQLIIKGEFVAAIEAVQSGRESLSKLSQVLNEYANDEAQKIRIWRRWVQETIDNSRANGSPAIIVDKSAHKLYIVQSGKVIRKVDCELGYNSGQAKVFFGRWRYAGRPVYCHERQNIMEVSFIKRSL